MLLREKVKTGETEEEKEVEREIEREGMLSSGEEVISPTTDEEHLISTTATNE